MSRYWGVSVIADSARRGAWHGSGLLLLALGIGSLGVALTGLVFAGGGVAFLGLAVPPLIAGYGILRRTRWARVFGLIVALAYAVGVAYVASTPLRGLTPPTGQSAPTIDPGSTLVAVAFLVAAILVLVGTADSRTGRR
jgi:hypothetical protein